MTSYIITVLKTNLNSTLQIRVLEIAEKRAQVTCYCPADLNPLPQEHHSIERALKRMSQVRASVLDHLLSNAYSTRTDYAGDADDADDTDDADDADDTDDNDDADNADDADDAYTFLLRGFPWAIRKGVNVAAAATVRVERSSVQQLFSNDGWGSNREY